SSRRRHTRCLSDWSSDVCSSDLLFGGLTGAEFWRIALALLNTLFVSLAAGICVSAFSRDARVAMAATFLVLLSLAIFHVAVFFFAYGTNYAGNSSWYWRTLAGAHVGGWTFLATA